MGMDYDRKENDDFEWLRGVKKQLEMGLNEMRASKLLSLLNKHQHFVCSISLFDGKCIMRKIPSGYNSRYKENVITLYRNIEFIGMSVYKPEATKGIPMECIYIPLTVIQQRL